jgi:hypothetical protein
VLGAADNDIDEYDQHIVAHEFQHFLEDEVSRSDTPGGPHSLDEPLDMRLAFSEGFANAFSAMVLNDPVYRDAFGASQGQVYRFDVERGQVVSRGWFNETSVQAIAWDLYDPANDDNVAIGYGPMHRVLRDSMRDGTPLTSIFSFITPLKQIAGVPAAAVDARVAAESIVGTSMDPYATTETNYGPIALADRNEVLPIYTDIAPNGAAVRLCGGRPTGGGYNKIGNRRFLRFNVPSARTLDIQVSCQVTDPTCTGEPRPDPDFALSRGRTIEFAETETPYVEQLRKNVEAGDYVLEIYEYSHADPDENAVRRGDTCMTVRITG